MKRCCVKHRCAHWRCRRFPVPALVMEPCCSLRYLVAVLVAAEIVLVVITINSISVDRVMRQKRWFTTPSPSDTDLTEAKAILDYDNSTVDEFLANYSIYCEKFLIPFVINIRHYSRATPLCPCIPSDLGLCFLHNIWFILIYINFYFTVQCYAERGIVMAGCLSMTLRCCGHIGY